MMRRSFFPSASFFLSLARSAGLRSIIRTDSANVRRVMHPLLLLVLSANAAECSGDIAVVLVNPVAVARANSVVADALMMGGDAGLLGDMSRLITFPLSIGLSNDGWDMARRRIDGWMKEIGIPGEASVWGLSPRRSGWLSLNTATGGVAAADLVQPGDPALQGLFPDERAIYIRVDDPQAAARSATGRGLGMFPASPRLTAQAAVVEALVPVLRSLNVDAFAHVGGGYCAEGPHYHDTRPILDQLVDPTRR